MTNQFRRIALAYRHGGAAFLERSPRLPEDVAEYLTEQLMTAIGEVGISSRGATTGGGKETAVAKILTKDEGRAAFTMARAVAGAFAIALELEGKEFAGSRTQHREGDDSPPLLINRPIAALKAIAAFCDASSDPNAPPSPVDMEAVARIRSLGELRQLDDSGLALVRAEILTRLLMASIPHEPPGTRDRFWELKHRNRTGRVVEDALGLHLAACLSGEGPTPPDIDALVAERLKAVPPDPLPNEEFRPEDAYAAARILDGAAKVWDLVVEGRRQAGPKQLAAELAKASPVLFPGAARQERVSPTAVANACRSALKTFGFDVDAQPNARHAPMATDAIRTLTWGAVEIAHALAETPSKILMRDISAIAGIVAAIVFSQDEDQDLYRPGNGDVEATLQAYRRRAAVAGSLASSLRGSLPSATPSARKGKLSPPWAWDEYRARSRRISMGWKPKR